MRHLVRAGLVGIVAVILGMPRAGAAAPILQISGGVLTGALGVEVAGPHLYDVTFIDGTCAGLFDGCDEPSDFPFFEFGALASQFALAASLELITQVFVDGPSGSFDSRPELTNGCSVSVFLVCEVLTPFQSGMAAITVNNGALPGFPPFPDDGGFSVLVGPTVDTSNDAIRVYARWTPAAPVAVLEPTSLFLLGTGIAGVLAKARRRRTQQRR